MTHEWIYIRWIIQISRAAEEPPRAEKDIELGIAGPRIDRAARRSDGQKGTKMALIFRARQKPLGTHSSVGENEKKDSFRVYS